METAAEFQLHPLLNRTLLSLFRKVKKSRCFVTGISFHPSCRLSLQWRSNPGQPQDLKSQCNHFRWKNGYKAYLYSRKPPNMKEKFFCFFFFLNFAKPKMQQETIYFGNRTRKMVTSQLGPLQKCPYQSGENNTAILKHRAQKSEVLVGYKLGNIPGSSVKFRKQK